MEPHVTHGLVTMVTLEKIHSPLFSNLYESFLREDDALSSEQDWRNLFDYRWDTEEGHCGYALLDADTVVGILGMVFSERHLDGVTRKFCNLHTWWVREDHRGRSLTLLRPVLQLNDYTITHLTPDDNVRAVTRRMGFSDLNSQLRILLPLSGVRGAGTAEASVLVDDPHAIDERLSDDDRKILLDHRPSGCGHLLINDGKRYCYLVYTHVVRHRLPYCHIHYMSDRTIFASKEPLVRAWLLGNHAARFVVVDDRLVQGMKLRRSFPFWAPAHALYKSSKVRPEQIDNLYSDVVLLKLTVLPDISHELGLLARRFWPS